MSRLRRGTGRVIAAGFATAALAVLAACGSSSTAGSVSGAGTPAAGQTSPAAANSQAGNTQVTAALAKAAQPITSWPGIKKIANPASVKGKKIMLVPLISQVAILNGMIQSEADALKHLGAQPTICDGKGNPMTIATCLQQAQAAKDFAVVTNFVAYQMVPNSFDSLAASGTKVLIGGDTPVPGKTYNPNIKFFDISSSLTPLFSDEADAVVADKGSNAGVLWLVQTDTPNQQQAGQNGIDHLKSICPACQVTTLTFTTANVGNLASQVSAQLVSHPNISVLVSPVDSFVAPAWQGVQSSGFATKVEVISTGSDLDGLQRVASGQEAHDFGASALYDGYAELNGLMQQLAGEPVDPALNVTRDFTKANVGSLKLTQAEYGTADWFGNNSFVNQYYKAWGAA